MFELGPKWDEEWNIVKDEEFDIKLPSEHNLKIYTQKRGAKTVTIIEPFFIKSKELKCLLKELKSKLGVGGAIKKNTLELQGEHIKETKEFFKSKSFKFKN